MAHVFQDWRFALRSLRKNPGFSLVAVATLALAIGANTAIFSVVHAALLHRLPFRSPDRLVMVWESGPHPGSERNVANPGNYMRWTERSRSFESLAAMTPWQANLAGSGEPARVKIGYVSGNFFSTLGTDPAAGRLLLPSDAGEKSLDVAVISTGLWRRRFGSDPATVGRDVRIDGVPTRIVGIAQPRFDFPAGTEVWAPMGFGPRKRDTPGRYLTVVGRLKAGVSADQAQAEMSSLSAALQKERPEVDAGWGTRVIPFREDVVGGFRKGLLILMSAVGCLLLIGCANLANLLLARGAARQREFAVRAALGASRGRLARLLLAESTLIGLAGGAAGIVLGGAGIRAILALVPSEFPEFLAIRVNVPVLVFTLSISLVVGVLVGVLPAFRLRIGHAPESLHGAGSRMTTASSRFSRVLVAFEVAGCVVLLAGAGLLLRSLIALWNVDPGFRTRDVLSFRLDLPSKTYAEPGKIASFYREAEERLRALPGVEDIGSVSWLPLGGPGAATVYHDAGQPAPKAGEEPVAEIRIVSDGFFRTMGVPLLRGRAFGREDSADAPRRVVISRQLARESFRGANPIGRRLAVAWGSDPGGETVEVIGVAGDTRFVSVDGERRPTIFFSSRQEPSNFMTILLRTSADGGTLAPAIRRVVAGLDPEIPVADVRSMTDVFADSLKKPRFFSTLLGVFSTLALVLAAVGVYGVVSYATARQTREIGIRIALGGRPVDVFARVMRQGLAPVAAGAVLGLAGALAAGRLMQSLLFGVPRTDWASLAGAVALLGAAAILACALPARRASRVNPTVALRSE
jgi:putative ABC transport system permease protein